MSVAPLPQVFGRLCGDKIALLPEPLGVRGESFAVPRGDLEFLAYLNACVQARTYDGWLKERANAWFVALDWADGLSKPRSQDQRPTGRGSRAPPRSVHAGPSSTLAGLEPQVVLVGPQVPPDEDVPVPGEVVQQLLPDLLVPFDAHQRGPELLD